MCFFFSFWGQKVEKMQQNTTYITIPSRSWSLPTTTYSSMKLVVKTSGGYYFAHYIHFTRYGMHAYMELSFGSGGFLREVLFFIAILFFLLQFYFIFNFIGRIAWGQKKCNRVWVEERGISSHNKLFSLLLKLIWFHWKLKWLAKFVFTYMKTNLASPFGVFKIR